MTNKKVLSIASDEAGVEVRCADGTSYQGSIVIGADGVNSCARKAIRSLIIESGESDIDGDHPFISTYRLLWFSAPRLAKLEPGSGCSACGKDMSSQTLKGREKTWVFFYERLKQPTREQVYYSGEDVRASAEKWSDLMIDDEVKFKDLFTTRYRAGMSNLDEGIVKHWNRDRIVLAGDSAHKFTPNAGLGYNNGVQDATVLANELHRLLESEPDPPVTALTGAFERYHTTRLGPLTKDFYSSASFTRLSAWETVIQWIMGRYVLRFIPFLHQFFANYGTTERLREQRPLDFVPGDEPFRGKVPWDFPMKEAPQSRKSLDS